MATTFNPNDYSRNDFVAALKGGMDFYTNGAQIKSDVDDWKSNKPQIFGMFRTLGSEITDTKNDCEADISAVDAKAVANKDLIRQIVYEGSNNRLDLTASTITSASEDVTATLERGVLSVVKSTTGNSDSLIVINNVAIAAGMYFIGTGDNLDPDVEVISMVIKNSDDEQEVLVFNDWNLAQYSMPTMSDGDTDTRGTIEIQINKNFASNDPIIIIPTCARKTYDNKYALPYFKAITEV